MDRIEIPEILFILHNAVPRVPVLPVVKSPLTRKVKSEARILVRGSPLLQLNGLPSQCHALAGRMCVNGNKPKSSNDSEP